MLEETNKSRNALNRLSILSALGALCMIPSLLGAGTVVSTLTDPDNPNLPKGATVGSCYAQEITPAVIETITLRTPLLPERRSVNIETGETTVIRAATFNTKVVQRIVSPRSEVWFETICPHLYTERFVNSLQRALRARGFYGGILTGWMDPQTNLAVKLYQRKLALNSDILAISTVEEFGLVRHRDFGGIGEK